MEDFEFVSPTHFVFGHNAESKLGPMLAERGARKVLLHYGGQSAIKSGLIDRVCASLEQAGIEYVKLGGVRPNPEIGLVREGVALCKENGVDWVLAVGGGSVVDSAKAIANGACIDYDVWELITKKYPNTEVLPIAVVLTIPAAGSEASKNTVISNDELGMKTGYASNYQRPKLRVAGRTPLGPRTHGRKSGAHGAWISTNASHPVPEAASSLAIIVSFLADSANVLSTLRQKAA